MPDVELKALQDELASTVAKIDRFVQGGIKVDSNNNVTVGRADAAEAKSLMDKASQLRTLIEAKKFGTNFEQWMGQVDPSSAVAVAALGQGVGMKSVGQAFTDSAEFKAFVQSGSNTMSKPFTSDIFDLSAKAGYNGPIEQKDIYNSLGSHPVNIGIGTVAQFDPMVPRAQRTARVRDLFPVARTSSNLIDFFRVVGFAENLGKGNAGMVPDYSGGNFGLKPQSKLVFTSDQATVKTIAHWEAIHRHTIQDVPAIQTTVNNELLYGLKLKEDDQILNGDGTGDNLRGVLNTPGIQQYTPGGTEWKSDSLRRAITLAVLAYYPPTGIVLHPNDWEDVELQRGTTNDHYAITTNIAIGATPQAWRLPVVETPAMNEGNFLVGAFGTAAQLYDRQEANIRISEHHQDYFIRNAVLILCEERLALAVKRPEAMVLGTYNG